DQLARPRRAGADRRAPPLEVVEDVDAVLNDAFVRTDEHRDDGTFDGRQDLVAVDGMGRRSLDVADPLLAQVGSALASVERVRKSVEDVGRPGHDAILEPPAGARPITLSL